MNNKHEDCAAEEKQPDLDQDKDMDEERDIFSDVADGSDGAVLDVKHVPILLGQKDFDEFTKSVRKLRNVRPILLPDDSTQDKDRGSAALRAVHASREAYLEIIELRKSRIGLSKTLSDYRRELKSLRSANRALRGIQESRQKYIDEISAVNYEMCRSGILDPGEDAMMGVVERAKLICDRLEQSRKAQKSPMRYIPSAGKLAVASACLSIILAVVVIIRIAIR